MANLSRRAKLLLSVSSLIAGYAYLASRGPQGLQAFLQKREEIRKLEQQVATMRAENEARKERIHRLETSPGEMDNEIRKQLKLQRPGETTIILHEPGVAQ